MRGMVVLVTLLTVGMAQCVSDSPITTDFEAPGATFDSSDCHGGVEVSDAAGVLDVLTEAPWDWKGPYSSGSARPPSVDVRVTGSVTLTGAEVPLPAQCLERADCRHVAVFSSSQPGTEVVGGQDWFEGESTITITDTTVRFSQTMMDTHPGPYNFVPLVTVSAPCGTPCRSGAFACQSDLSCYGSYDAYCRLCEGRSVEECACRTEDGVAETGTSCSYFISGDAMATGECRAGVCMAP